MRILILSANTGGGHNSAAKAIAEEFKKQQITCEIADCLSFISKRASGLIGWGHSYVYRNLPKLFGVGYRFEEKHPPRFIVNRCASGADGLYEKLQENFDAVVCVHVFAALMMNAVRCNYGLCIPFCLVATDYTCSPGTAESQADLYFIPHEALTDEFVRAGIDAEKLCAYGIPIAPEFYQTHQKREAQLALGILPEQRLVLLGGGSMGAGNLAKEAVRLRKGLPEDCVLCVLCGNNRKLYTSLKRKSSERFLAVPFTDNVPLYMSAADLYITKPGGLTTTEAIAKRLPIVLIDAVPGCETRNFHFLVDCGVASGASEWRGARELVIKHLSESDFTRQSVGQMNLFMPHRAAERLCRRVISLLSQDL